MIDFSKLEPVPKGIDFSQLEPATPEVDEGWIPDYIEKPFMRGIGRTIEDAPKVARNVAGGSISGLADLGRTISSIPSPLDLIGVTQQAPEPEIFNRLTSLGEKVAVDITSPEYGVGSFITPVPPMGRAAKTVKTAYGKAIDAIVDVDEKRRATKALDKLDEMGYKDLSADTRGKLLDELNLKTTDDALVKSEENIKSKLDKVIKDSKTNYDELYSIANKEGSQTRAVDIAPIKDLITKTSDGVDDKILQRALNKGVDEDVTKTYDKINAQLTDSKSNNAADIEDLIKWFKEEQRKSDGASKMMYGRAINGLENQQQILLKEKGVPNLYLEARDAWQTHQKEFKGKLEGYGTTGGKSVASVNKARDNYDVSEALLGGDFDANLAQQVGKNFKPQERRDMVFTVLSKGIDDIDGLNTDTNVYRFINNFEAADPRGLRKLLGEDGYREAKKTVDALAYVQAAIKVAGKESADISGEILELGAALAAMKISPYAATHVGINKGKSILQKKGFIKSKVDLIARTKEIKDATVRNNLLKALRQMQPLSTGYINIADAGQKEE